MSKGLHLRGGEFYTTAEIKEIRNYYINKYYNLFMNKFEFNLSEEQANYLMRTFWGSGSIAAIRLRGTKDDNPEYVVFAPYAPSEFNLYDYPTKVTLINKRGVKFIPNTLQAVNKTVVLGRIQPNNKGVYEMIYPLIQKLVNVEITFNQNLRALRQPFIIVCAPETENKMNELVNGILEGNGKLFLSTEDVKNIQVFNSNAQVLFDKLLQTAKDIDGQIREYLGLENLGGTEKKEHLITAEVQSNDEVTEEHKSIFYDYIQTFFDHIREVLGITLTITEKHTDEEEPASEGEEYEDI